MRYLRAALLLAMAAATHAAAQECAVHTSRMSGEVRDTTGALVVDASVLVDGAESVHSDKQGVYTTLCVADGGHTLLIPDGWL